jgi:hypothetical protein
MINMCKINLSLPDGSLMILVKIICHERDRPSVNPGQFGMKVVEVSK